MDVSNKFKRQMDDWFDKGICARHKYINSFFKFIWYLIKRLIKGIIFSIFFIIGLVLYKAVRETENEND